MEILELANTITKFENITDGLRSNQFLTDEERISIVRPVRKKKQQNLAQRGKRIKIRREVKETKMMRHSETI